MGQKVNPNGFRVGVIKDWNTRWYASKKDFSDYLVEDKKIGTTSRRSIMPLALPRSTSSARQTRSL